MADQNNVKYDLSQNTSDVAADEEIVEGFGPVMRVLADNYCENLVNPDESKRIEPKKLYITLGAAVAGSVLLFFLLGWLLCYCPLNTTGYSADDFIREFNSMTEDPELTTFLDQNIQMMAVSGADIKVLYPDFSDLTIPEDADLEEGVLLCDGNMQVKADLIFGKIQKLTVSVSENCENFNSRIWKFETPEGVDFDYSAFPYYAAAGNARLAFYNLVRAEEGLEPTAYNTSDAIGYCMGMLDGAYYSFADAEDYNANQSYFEYKDNMMLYFVPESFMFCADSRSKPLHGKDNGLYEFYDSIFGEKPEKETDSDVSTETTNPVPEVSGTVSASEVTPSDVSAADASAQ